jgi:hypothetical protein
VGPRSLASPARSRRRRRLSHARTPVAVAPSPKAGVTTTQGVPTRTNPCTSMLCHADDSKRILHNNARLHIILRRAAINALPPFKNDRMPLIIYTLPSSAWFIAELTLLFDVLWADGLEWLRCDVSAPLRAGERATCYGADRTWEIGRHGNVPQAATDRACGNEDISVWAEGN